METFKHKNGDAPIHVYKVSGWAQFRTWLFVLLILGHFSFILQSGIESTWLMVVFVPIYALILWALLLSSSQRHLAVYEHGLEYRFGNSLSFSRWEDLRRFESRASGKSRGFGIYTQHLENRSEGNAFERFMLGSYKDFIPLSLVHVPTRWEGFWGGAAVDTAKFAETEFGRKLLHYAPQLFEESTEKAKNG